MGLSKWACEDEAGFTAKVLGIGKKWDTRGSVTEIWGVSLLPATFRTLHVRASHRILNSS